MFNCLAQASPSCAFAARVCLIFTRDRGWTNVHRRPRLKKLLPQLRAHKPPSPLPQTPIHIHYTSTGIVSCFLPCVALAMLSKRMGYASYNMVFWGLVVHACFF